MAKPAEPLLKRGEVCLCKVSAETFARSTWQTKRLGKPDARGLAYLFVKRIEVETRLAHAPPRAVYH